ncbi:unnamed protein product [Clavelina lepadiformis]|uniref:Tetratricopeptide repeat protein n=1 Tax=Clavelina lepadiformis TaxID=159417 RepID=A0ABP0G0I6_CLALP
MSHQKKCVLFKREYDPIPHVQIIDAVQFVGTGNLTTGSGDLLYLDKTTKAWRRWVYFKCKYGVPDLCTNLYENKSLIERIEKACLATSEGYRNVAEDYFLRAMEECVKQFSNPRSDSALALDRLGAMCLQANEYSKAITCFEYSLHMRRLLYGKDASHENILTSLVYLGTAWAQYANNHR